jgi:predicted GH43/DUF377 family glycosyl hydrolase
MNTKFNLERYPSNTNPKPILTPRKDIAWEAMAVFNPCVVYDNTAGLFRMLYRTFPVTMKLGRAKEIRPGFRFIDQTSYIGYAESKDGINFERRPTPFISPDQPFDAYGCEDPRITKIGDTFYITYTAIDAQLGGTDRMKKANVNVRIALATTKDFINVEKHGIIGPPTTSKAGAFFSEPVNKGKIAFIMTISSDSENSHVAIRYYDSIEEIINQSANREKADAGWKKFLENSKDTTVLKTYWWLSRGPELGAPPIKTDRGWLLIYSAEAMSHSWVITAALTDLNEPHKLIARAPSFILQPVTDYERDGLVPQVTFPSGAVVVGNDFDRKLYVYYGAADTVIGLATCKLEELLKYLDGFKGKE